MEVLAVVPARGGSKSIPLKNLHPLRGQPLIRYSIDAARASRYVTRCVISTDSDEIASYAAGLGVAVPFLRPARLAQDDTLMLPVIQHALDHLREDEGYEPAVVVILQPTTPLRRPEHIDDGVNKLLSTGADSVVSVVEVPHQFNPISVMRIEDDRLLPYQEGEGVRVLRRQDKPTVYARNGAAVHAIRTRVVSDGSLFGKISRPLIMKAEDSVDIDGAVDLLIADALLAARESEESC